MLRQVFIAVLLVGVFLAGAGPAAAITVNFDFSDGLGQNFEFLQANATTFTLNTSNDNLNIISPGTSGNYGVKAGYVLSKFTIQGDFDLRVDYDESSPYQNLTNQQQQEMHINAAGWFFYVVRQNYGGNDLHIWDGAEHGNTPASDTSGKMRITRVGSTVSGYYSSGGDTYNLLYAHDYGTQDVTLSLWLQNNWNGDSSLNAAFDNLSITAGGLNGYVPVPPSALLLGSGLVGLLAWRRFRRPAA
jgi:hypothetical protein